MERKSGESADEARISFTCVHQRQKDVVGDDQARSSPESRGEGLRRPSEQPWHCDEIIGESWGEALREAKASVAMPLYLFRGDRPRTGCKIALLLAKMLRKRMGPPTTKTLQKRKRQQAYTYTQVCGRASPLVPKRRSNHDRDPRCHKRLRANRRFNHPMEA